MIKRIASLALAATLSTIPALAAEKHVSVVLVHGAFVDGSGWQKVYGILSRAGYDVLVTQISTETLEGDVSTVERAISRAKHPVLLVGHSYGGAVITEAGTGPKVHSLLYLAAYALDAGESVASLKPVAGAPPIPLLPPQDGFLTLDVEKFPTSFAPDADPATGKFMAASQVPWGVAAANAKIDRVAWKSKPTFYVVTADDLIIPPQSQREMAARAGAKVTEISSSHAVMLSHPDEVATLIEHIADTMH